MKCPFCKNLLPEGKLPARCPTCGKVLEASTASAEITDDQSPLMAGMLMTGKVALWIFIALVGTTAVVLSILFAGCVCSGMR